jgi:hypothetical protein
MAVWEDDRDGTLEQRLAVTPVSGAFTSTVLPTTVQPQGVAASGATRIALVDEDQGGAAFIAREIGAGGAVKSVPLGAANPDFGEPHLAAGAGRFVAGWIDETDAALSRGRLWLRGLDGTWKELSPLDFPSGSVQSLGLALAPDGRIGVTIFVDGDGIYAVVSGADGSFASTTWHKLDVSKRANLGQQIGFGAGGEAIVSWTSRISIDRVAIRAATAAPGKTFTKAATLDADAGLDANGVTAWLSGAASGARLAWTDKPKGARTASVRVARRTGGTWSSPDTLVTTTGTVAKPRVAVVAGGEVAAWRLRPRGKSPLAQVSTRATGAKKWTAPTTLSSASEKVGTVSIGAGGPQAYLAWDTTGAKGRVRVLASRVRP